LEGGKGVKARTRQSAFALRRSGRLREHDRLQFPLLSTLSPAACCDVGGHIFTAPRKRYPQTQAAGRAFPAQLLSMTTTTQNRFDLPPAVGSFGAGRFPACVVACGDSFQNGLPVGAPAVVWHAIAGIVLSLSHNASDLTPLLPLFHHSTLLAASETCQPARRVARIF
jgi:hypothetical protein